MASMIVRAVTGCLCLVPAIVLAQVNPQVNQRIQELEQELSDAKSSLKSISDREIFPRLNLAYYYHRAGQNEKCNEQIRLAEQALSGEEIKTDRSAQLKAKTGLGRLLTEIKQAPRGIEILEEVSAIDPDASNAPYYLARGYELNDQTSKAIEFAEANLARVKLIRDDRSFEFALAHASLAEALRSSRSGNDMRTTTENVEATKRAAILYKATEKWCELPENQQNTWAVKFMAVYAKTLVELNRFKEALPKLKYLLSESKSSFRLTLEEQAFRLIVAGSIRVSEGEFEQGSENLKEYSQVLEKITLPTIDHSVFARNALSSALFESQEYERALDSDLKIIESDSLMPQSNLWIEVQIRRASCHFALGRTEQAEALLNEVFLSRKFGHIKEAHLGLYEALRGRINQSKGQTEASIAEFSKAFELLDKVENQTEIWRLPHNHIMRELADSMIRAAEVEMKQDVAAKWKERSEKYR